MADESKADDNKTVRLVSQEGESFDVPVGVASMSELVKSMIDGKEDKQCAIYICICMLQMQMYYSN
jgi:hypothetical protein